MNITRITAQLVNTKLDKHLEKHEDVYDKALDRHEILLLGEKSDTGLCKMVNILEGFYKGIDGRLEKIEGGLMWLNRLIIGAVILAILGVILIK
ncbi:hypothetical protein MUP56_02465 [Patescibacteria group bacterium]|nr:hypothetical protein [Patescibacteria group bacterium]